MSGAAKWGGEVLVNTATDGQQAFSSMTALADGRFVVSWQDSSHSGGDTDGSAVRAQIFDADGTKLGSELLVNTATAGDQLMTSVTSLGNGGFVATWWTNVGSGDVHAQVFTADGAKVGAEFQVNTISANLQWEPTTTELADGRFVVSWQDFSQSGDDPDGSAIRAQAFNADGTKSGGELLVNTTTWGNQTYPTITGLADGRFVATWTDHSHSGDDLFGAAVRGQVFNADGTHSGTEFRVNTAIIGDQQQPAVASLVGGGFVVTWSDSSHSGGDVDGTAVRMQLFHANGTPASGELLVNTTTAGDQGDPAVASFDDGRFVVAWTDVSHSPDDPDGSAVRAQVFNADGSKFGAEFLVDTTTAGNQLAPTVTVLADGRFAVSWTDTSGSSDDPSDSAVRTQIFDSRDHAELLVGTSQDDHYVGTAFPDQLVGDGGADTMEGGDGNDFLSGYSGDDTLDGGADADLLNGGSEDDVLHGGTGDDTMTGGTGNDTFYVDSQGDVVLEDKNGGIDTVHALLNYTLGDDVENLILDGEAKLHGTGNALDNLIVGNSASNVLNGGGGQDILAGAGGSDTLIGGGGGDLLNGGAGNDHFTFKSLSDSGPSAGQGDLVADFHHGDKIDLSAIDANVKAAGDQAFHLVAKFSGHAGELHCVQTGASDYLVTADVDGDKTVDFSLSLHGGAGFGQILASDFIL